MKKSLFLLGGSYLALPINTLAAANPQIIIAFNPLGGTAQAIPMSPWLYGLMVLMLTGVVFLFMQKQAKSSLFLFALTAILGVSASLTPKLSEAIPVLTTLSSSPTSTDTGPLQCGLNNVYTFTNGLPNGLVITSTSLNPPYEFITIDPSSTCQVGTTLTGSQQCTVILKETCI